MESIDGDAKPSVICAFSRGVWVYPSDHYKKRTEIQTDLSNGKLYLTLKDVKKEDEGIYKCQAANKEDHKDKEIRLFVTNPVNPLLIQKAEGDSVTFQADYSGPRDEILWKIGPEKIVELKENGSHYYRLSDRASASFYGGFLTIRDLVESDSRDYSGNILNEGEYHETKFILKVTHHVESGTKKRNRVAGMMIIPVILVLSLFFFIWTKRCSLRSVWSRISQDYSGKLQKVPFHEENPSDATENNNDNPVTTCETVNEMEIKDFLENKDTERERDNDVNNE